MEAVCLIQTSREDQGFTNVSVYLDIPETSARLTLTIADLIHVHEVITMHADVTLFDRSRKILLSIIRVRGSVLDCININRAQRVCALTKERNIHKLNDFFAVVSIRQRD